VRRICLFQPKDESSIFFGELVERKGGGGRANQLDGCGRHVEVKFAVRARKVAVYEGAEEASRTSRSERESKPGSSIKQDTIGV
jgi:hypothetical protein